jgi:hypothetical protein
VKKSKIKRLLKPRFRQPLKDQMLQLRLKRTRRTQAMMRAAAQSVASRVAARLKAKLEHAKKMERKKEDRADIRPNRRPREGKGSLAGLGHRDERATARRRRQEANNG